MPWQTRLCGCVFALLAACSAAAAAADLPTLDEHLEPFRPLLEKTWRGEFKSSRPGNPVVDVMRCERALNGKAVRILHSVNDGAYGGETIFMWDEGSQSIRYHYFTTAGFTTTGDIRIEDGKIKSHEVVKGNSGGITEVRGTSEVLTDGTYLVKTEYLKDGQWGPGREVSYREDAAARVVFK